MRELGKKRLGEDGQTGGMANDEGPTLFARATILFIRGLLYMQLGIYLLRHLVQGLLTFLVSI